ncbi:hypothetical protein K8S19_01910 [bacterium]|nr:hypothetical protein [bacterium]
MIEHKNGTAEFGMTSRVLETVVKDGMTVTVMESLLDTNQNGKVEAGEKKITGSDMYGNVYGMIEHKNGTAEFGMTSKVFETVMIDGLTVTKMEALLDLDMDGTLESGERTITGTDMYGNQYSVDKKGKLGAKNEFLMTTKIIGTVMIDGMTVTKTLNLIEKDATETGTDMYGNQYGIDKRGIIRDMGEFRMISEYIGMEVVNGLTVTKLDDLLKGDVTGTDMYGNQYAEDEHGNLRQVSRMEIFTVEGKDIKLTLSLEDESTMIRGLGKKPIEMGMDVKVAVEGDKIIFTDVRGVREVYTIQGRRMTKPEQKFTNIFKKFTFSVSSAWSKFAEGTREEAGATWGKVAAESAKLVGRVTLAVVVGALDTVGTALRTSVEVSLDVILTIGLVGLIYYAVTGESLGAWVVDTFIVGVEWVFKPVDFVFQKAGEGLKWVGDHIIQYSEKLTAMGLHDLAGKVAVVALAFHGLGDSLTIIFIIALKFIPVVGLMVSGIAAAVMLGKDALINGLGSMFKNFFVEPVFRVVEGWRHAGDHSRPGSHIMHFVDGMSQIIGGAVGLYFAYMMIKVPLMKAIAKFREVRLERVKNKIIKEVENGNPEILEMTLEQVAKEVGLKPKKGSNWGKTKVKDLKITSPKGQGVTIGKLFSSNKGQLINMLKSRGFNLSQLIITSGAHVGQSLTAAMSVRPMRGFALQYVAQSIVALVKASGTLVASFGKHQVMMIVNAGKMIKLLAKGKTMIKTKSGKIETVKISEVAPRLAPLAKVVGRFTGAMRVRMTGIRNTVVTRITGRQISPAKPVVPGAVNTAKLAPLKGTPLQEKAALLKVKAKRLAKIEAGKVVTEKYQKRLIREVQKLKTEIKQGIQDQNVRAADTSLKPAERQAASRESALLNEILNVENGKTAIVELQNGIKTLRADTKARTAKLAKLEARVESAQKLIDGVEAKIQLRAKGKPAAALTKLDGMKNQIKTRMKADLSPKQLAEAKAELKQVSREMTLQKAKQRVAKLKAEITKESPANESALKELSSLEAKLEAKQEMVMDIESRQQQRQDLVKTETKLQTKKQGIAEQTKALKAKLEKAQTPEARKSTESRVTRLEIAMERVKNQQKQVKNQQKILDLDAQFENTTDAKRSYEFLDKKADTLFDQAGLQSEAQEIAGRMDAAAMEQAGTRIQELARRTADPVKGESPLLSEAQIEKLTKAFTKEGGKPIEGRRQLIKLLKAMSQGGNIDAMIKARFQGPAAALRLRAMAENGMKAQAQTIFEKLSAKPLAEGKISPAQQNALAKELGLDFSSELPAKAGGAKNIAQAKERILGIQESAAREPGSLDVRHGKNRAAIEKFYKDVGKAGKTMSLADARIEGLIKSRAPVGKIIEQLMGSRSPKGRAAVREMLRRMTPDQVRELLTSSDPRKMIQGFETSQTSQIMGRQAKMVLKSAEKQLDAAKANVEKLSKQGGEGLQNAEKVLKQAKAEFDLQTEIAGSKDVINARSEMIKIRKQAGQLRRQLKKPTENLQKAEAEATTAQKGLLAAEKGVEAAKTSGKGLQAAKATLEQTRTRRNKAKTDLIKAEADYMKIANKFNAANLALNRAEAKIEAAIAKQKPTGIEAAQAKSSELVKNAESKGTEITRAQNKTAETTADANIQKAKSGVFNAETQSREAGRNLKNSQGKQAQTTAKVELKKAQKTLRTAERSLKMAKVKKSSMMKAAEAAGKKTTARLIEKAKKQGAELVREAEIQAKKTVSLAEHMGDKVSPAKIKGLIKRSQQMQEAVKARDLLEAKLRSTSDATARESLKTEITKAEARVDRLGKLALEKPIAGNAVTELYTSAKLALKRLSTRQDSAMLRYDVDMAVERVTDPKRAKILKATLEKINDLQAKIEKSMQSSRKDSPKEQSKRKQMIEDRLEQLDKLQDKGFSKELLESIGLKDITTSDPAVLKQVGIKIGEVLVKLEGKGNIRKLGSELQKAIEAKDTAKIDALTKKYQAEVAKRMPEIEAAIERILPKEMNSQARMIAKELIKQFQADPLYRTFTLDQPMLSFLFRQAELHYLNMELHIKNPAMKAVIGEALQLAMGGGKSASVITMKVAMELFKVNHPGMKVPAMLYMTVNPSLVRQILGEPAFKQMAKEGMLIELTKETSADVIKNGFKEGKMYVTDCETMKHIVLEMRSAGKTDIQISRLLQDKLGTVAWDEFHAAFHVTDTIIGASGIAPYLSSEVQTRMGDVAMQHIKMYGQVREWFVKKVTKNGVVQKNKVLKVFENVESGVGKEVRNQLQFTAEALKEIRSATNLDYAKSGDRIMLDKMAKVLSTKNGREWTGEMRKGKSSYGTMEGGEGKPNTIFGDQLQAAFTNIEVFFQSKGEGIRAHRAAMHAIKSPGFRARNGKFVEAVVEALVHTTTERVTMLEAVNLLGAQNIVGFSGTFEGIKGTLATWGKRLNMINREPVIDMFDIVKKEAYFQVKVGQDVITMRRDSHGRIKMELSHEGYNERTALVREALKLMEVKLDTHGRKITQQIFTHNDNSALAKIMTEIKQAMKTGRVTGQKYNTQTVKINAESIQRFVKNHPKIAEYNKDGSLTRKSIETAIQKMIKHPGKEMVQLVLIEGMAPELRTVAMGKLESIIQDGLGWKQKRMIFAPKVGEGLNTLATKGHMQKMGAAIHQLDMRPLDVYRQAMKRVNVSGAKSGTYKRARGIGGMSLDLNDINNITRGEIKQFKTLVEQIRTAMATGGKNSKILTIDISAKKVNGQRTLQSTNTHFKLFTEFSDMLVGEGKNGKTMGIAKRILQEVDIQKTQASLNTQAGIQTETTVSVSVAKSSPKYMAEMAKTVERSLPEMLRKYQGITDIAAHRVGTPRSALSQILVMPNYAKAELQTRSGWHRIPGVRQIAGYFEARTSAIQASGAQIQLVTQYAKTWQSESWQNDNAATVAQYQAQHGDHWVDAKLTEKFGESWSLYQAVGEAGNVFSQIRVMNRGVTYIKNRFESAVRDMTNVSAKLPELQAEPKSRTLTYQGRTMDLKASTAFVRKNLMVAQNLAVQYGFKLAPQLVGTPGQNAAIASNSRMFGEIGTLQAAIDNPLTRFVQSVRQGWQNTLRLVQKMPLLFEPLQIEAGRITPSTVGRIIAGAGLVGLVSLTNLPLTGLMLGMALPMAAKAVGLSGLLAQVPFLSKFLPSGITGQTATRKKSPVSQLALPLAGLALGAVFLPGMAMASVGALHNQFVEHVFTVSKENSDRVIVNEVEPIANVTVGKETHETNKSLVEKFKERMAGEKKDGAKAVAALEALLTEAEVELAVGQRASHYGYMHMVAAVLSLVPGALDRIRTVEIGARSKPEKKGKAGKKITVTADRIKYLDQGFSATLMTQTILAAVDGLFSDAQSYALNERLRQQRMFKEYGGNALAEFIKQYITDGENLRTLINGNAALQSVYDQVNKAIGREYAGKDITELTEAAGELENQAFGLMKHKAADIQQADKTQKLLREEEFSNTFGVSYAAYLKMIRPTWIERVVVRLVGQDRLDREKPLLTVKTYILQLVGLLSVAVIGAALGVAVLSGAAIGGMVVLLGLAGVGIVYTAAWLQAENMAFHANPTGAVKERLAAENFASIDPVMAARASQIARLTGADEFKRRREFKQKYKIDYETYRTVSLETLFNDPYFKKTLNHLRIAGTDRMISETMRNRAIRIALQHLLQMVASDIPQEMKLAITRDIIQVLGALQFDIKMTYKKYADDLTVTLTPEAVPRSLTRDYKLGRIIKRLENLGIGIKLEMQPLRKQPKLKTTGSAA